MPLVQGHHAPRPCTQAVLPNKKKLEIACCPPTRAGSARTIPSTVKTLGPNFFADAKKLTKVTLGKNVRVIDWYALDNSKIKAMKPL